LLRFIFFFFLKIERYSCYSKAAERTGYRSARRKIFRRRKRKQATLKVLIQHNMCPLSLEDLQAWEKSKKAYPSATEFIEWQKCYHIKSTSVSDPQNRNVYYLRSKAVHEKLSPHELGRVMYLFAQRRGFLSNRLDQTKADETGKVKGAISELQTRKGDRTLGELFYEYHLEGKKVRGHYTGRKEDYLQEFNRICEVQNVAPELKTELYNAIFFQRPKKKKKGSIRFKTTERPDWDHYFMAIAHVAARRSNCNRRQVAAVIVKDQRIISTGYNGTPRGIKNCNEGGCPRCNSDTPSGQGLTECLCSHGEENAIVQAAYHGIAVKDATLYTTFSPCLLCAKMIINSGIREVVYHERYSIDGTARRLLLEAGVIIRALNNDDEVD